MKFCIVDPLLFIYGGHPFTGAYAGFVEAKRIGWECSVIGLRTADPAMKTEFDGRFYPVLRHMSLMRVSADPLSWPIHDFQLVGDCLFEDIQPVLADFGPQDAVFFTNVSQNYLSGICRWLASMPIERRPKTSVLLRFANYEVNTTVAMLYRYSCQQFAALGACCRLFTETEALKQHYERVTGVTFRMLPPPLFLLDDVPTEHIHDGGPLNVVFAGHPGEAKGFPLLPDIIAACRAEGAPVHFQVQANATWPFITPKCRATIDRLKAMAAPDLTIIEGELSIEAYTDLVLKSDIMLQPYEPFFYGIASSGIFVEAMALGKVIVAPDGSWMWRELESFSGGGASFAPWTAEAVATALLSAVRNYAALATKARAAAIPWRAHAGASRLMEMLIA